MRNLGVRVERADMRWVGARRKKSTQVFLGGGVLGVGSTSHSVNIGLLNIFYYLLVWMGCFVLGPEKQLLLVQWRHSTATQKNNYY